jgi:gamma-polyglutamate synthase
MASGSSRPLKKQSEAVGPLRARVAREELARVERVAAGGVQALLAHALELVDRVAREEQALRDLSRAIESEPARAEAAIASFLTETATSPADLKKDLEVLRKSRGKRLNLPALTERAAIRGYRSELEGEVALAMLRATVDASSASLVSIDALLGLAQRPGRWSLRVEALSVLRVMTRYPLAPEVRNAVASTCVALMDPSQHRWVQPGAAEVLARVDVRQAQARVSERMEAPLGGDDFLVRERFVALAARMRRPDWQVLLEVGASDPSEHVRLTVARVERNSIRLTHLATSDASEKVRAQALLSLAKRGGGEVEPTLLAAASRDKGPFVVRTAAEALALVAQRKAVRNRRHVEDALVYASNRSDLPLDVRLAIVEELARIAVLADPYLRIVYDLLVKIVAATPVGGSVRVVGKALENVTDEQMGRVLSVLSQNDFGLYADRVADGFVVHRGEARMAATWRALFEVTHPLPSKRQGYTHSWARRLRGALRAPPRGLAELTATAVPGERVLVGQRGDWGRHLPLVDDLLSTVRVGGGITRIVGPQGTTTLTPPSAFGARVRAWMTLTKQYAKLAELRRRSLDSDEAAIQRGYAEAIAREAGITIEFSPHPFGERVHPPAEVPQRTAAAALVPLGALGAQADGLLRDLLHYGVSAEGNRLPHLGAYAAAMLLGMIARAVVMRRRIDDDRKSIPLVVGGWGTRGKSGTERLKAALFQGLGYEVLVKTTGCEAMFIHAIPGLRAHEVFIYRPYDKATIWEQRTLLHLARRFHVGVFLWECMALQPDLVNVLQEQWVRDDYSTITNAYPDHEDVQGPAGMDVAQCISEFVPTEGRLFTAEDQMLPILRERAKARRTSIRAIGGREASLIADDVLARYPYHEHPKNIALVCALAQALGIPTAVALVEMADHVVPDLGVLKTYPRVPYAGRTVAFTNGMSANERTGALSNWVRMGFDKHEVDDDPQRFIVTVVNNRADRVARSEVFARFVVQDIAAHKHVLIGTNVSGLLGFVMDALSKHLVEIAPSRDLAGAPAARHATVMTRLERAFKKLKVGDPTPESVAKELAALGLPALDPRLLAQLLSVASPEEDYTAARRAVGEGIDASYSAEARAFVVSTIARRRAVVAVHATVRASLTADPARVDALFTKTYRAMFEESVVALHDSTLTGDQVVDAVVRSAPPGARVDIMGVQNIKGTGLDFVYRWVSLDTVERALAKVKGTDPAKQDEGLRELLTHDDFGLVDARYAHDVIASLDRPGEQTRAVLSRIEGLVEAKTRALSATRSRTAVDVVRGVIGKTFDYLDSVRRQRMAREVVEDLVAGRLSHAAAAVEMRNVVARAKGGWALAKKS